jgi:hypothetical protein
MVARKGGGRVSAPQSLHRELQQALDQLARALAALLASAAERSTPDETADDQTAPDDQIGAVAVDR